MEDWNDGMSGSVGVVSPVIPVLAAIDPVCYNTLAMRQFRKGEAVERNAVAVAGGVFGSVRAMKYVSAVLLCGVAFLAHGGTWAAGSPAGGDSADGPVISEFLASNTKGLLDRDRESSDWIEIFNPTGEAVDLDGWFLTDDSTDLEQWGFPAVTIPPNGYLVVFASGKDGRDPGAELHTNFKLTAGGEDLALVRPDGSTVADSYSYPQQFANVSYGRTADVSLQTTGTELISENAGARALIPADGSLGLAWTSLEFDDSAWWQGQTGVGFDYGALVRLDVSSMRNRNKTVYIRIAFEVADASAVATLTLRMRYEDGFVAYLNGQPVASANAPQPDQLQWNSGATASRLDEVAVEFEDFDISARKDLIRTGRNVLAVQGLNVTLSSSDLLVLPVLVASKTEAIDLPKVFEGYFPQPTPGATNNRGLAQLGPAIHEVSHTPVQPVPGGELTVTAQVEATFAPVADVRLFARLDYYPEGTLSPAEGLAMLDDGVAPDAAAGDGVYSAAVPAAFLNPGFMVRWYVRATDADGRTSRDPLFPLPNDSPRYYGTIVMNPAISSQLPTLIWFTENPTAAATRTGTRASVFFDGEFYDNIFVRQRGGATVGAGSKKFVFNKGRKFRFSDAYGRVEEFNLNQNGSDPSYLRQPLGFETHRGAGCPASESFLMLSVLNRQVDRVGIFVEQVDEEFLERNGLDPRGALYKFVQRSQITPVFNDTNSGIEKRTRKYEDFSDIRTVVNGLNAPTAEQRRAFVFDSFNLPGMLAAGACIVLARNQSAFTSRYGGNVSLAPGTYTGSLDNAGEKIELQDRTGSTIQEFEYDDEWFPTTDGQDYSLTIKNPASTDLTSWSRKDAWRASPAKNGSPGA